MKNILIEIPDCEDKKTINLFKELESLKKQDYLTKDQLPKILHWKSPRPFSYYNSNNEEDIRNITTLAFSTSNDNLKIHILTALNGVNYPSASTILMFYDPSNYPVLEIRVWRQLYKANLVDTNSRGQNFTLKQCETYFQVVRKLSNDLDLTAR